MKDIMPHIVQIFSVSTFRYFLIAGVPFLLFYLFIPSKAGKMKIQPKAAAKKDFFREIWHSMQSTLVFTFIAAALLFTPLRNYTRIYSEFDTYPLYYIGITVIVGLIIHDTYFYWMHRLMHHKAIFKLTHLVHHKSTNPSPWASYSFHIAEAVVEGGILVVLTMLIPMHPLAIALFTISAFIINVYGHLGYEIMPKGFRKSWMFEVFNTSVHHNLHHSKFKGNYGLYFRVWDRVMGTEHPDYVKTYDKVQAQRFGE